jgi:predicted SAM-dependent methyltransferase
MHCGALERHRLVWLYLKERTDLFDGKPRKMLHVAPEAVFKQLFARLLGEGYLTADLNDPAAMVKMDITEIGYPVNSFDVVYCSHVLEHVPDDRKAMREFHRVLKPGGWAMLLVPIVAGETQEDMSITDPAERARVYGQADHVRNYGADFIDRLEEAGFAVTMTDASDLCSDSQRREMGITEAAGEIFYCIKRCHAACASGLRAGVEVSSPQSPPQ